MRCGYRSTSTSSRSAGSGGAPWVSCSGKVAFVTGAAHGQGRASALALAREGAAVAGLRRRAAAPLPRLRHGNVRGPGVASPPTARRPAARARPSPATCATTPRSTPRWTCALARFGRIDILFNNAGICAYGLAHELTEEAWDTMLDINLKGAWLVARRVIPVMIRQRSGVIINNSSVAGLRGMGRLSHYAASKWGLTGLTKSWAIELAPHGIRVNAIHPTGVNTPMNDGLAELEGLTPQRDRRALGGQPAAGALDRAGGRGRRRCSTWPPTAPASSPARASCSTRGCSPDSPSPSSGAPAAGRASARPACCATLPSDLCTRQAE